MLNKLKEQRGGALIIVMVMTLVLLGSSAAMVIVSTAQGRAIEKAAVQEQCYAILQAGVAESLQELNKQTDPNTGSEGIDNDDFEDIVINTDNDGATNGWLPFAGGFYQVDSTKLESLGRYRLIVRAVYNGVAKSAEVIVQAKPTEKEDVTTRTETVITVSTIKDTPFVNAFFQGNNGDEEGRKLVLAGVGAGADRVNAFPPTSHRGTYSDFNAIRAAEADSNVTNDDDPKTGLIPGNIYSTADVDITDGAFVAPGAEIRSEGEVNITSSAVDPAKVKQTGGSGINNPEIPDYDNLAGVIPVNLSDFNSDRTLGFSDGGLTTEDINDPRHIFIANPDRRHSSDINGTTRNDFFLDDPYTGNFVTTGRGRRRRTVPELRHTGGGGVDLERNYDGSGFNVSLSPQGNNKVYFIDGNMWIHNKETFSLQINTVGDGTRATFVTKGNIFISDNLLYQNLEKDAIALIAIKDSRDEPDEFGRANPNATREGSGNIQFGDPQFGTTFRFSGFMFAENDFLADNVSNSLFVYGNMTAGNEVKISRGSGTDRNSLVIDYDARIQLGADDPNHPLAIFLPGLPKNVFQDVITTEEETEVETTEINTFDSFDESTYEVVGMAEITLEDGFIPGEVPAFPDKIRTGKPITGLSTSFFSN